jgi:hypothetical protein
MPDWVLGSLIFGIIALPFIMSPQGGEIIRNATAVFVALIWRSYGWCDSILWKDLPEQGSLHNCNRGCVAATGRFHHQQRPACWEALLKALFNRT